MTKRDQELKEIQAAYREWMSTNPKFINEQSATPEDELRLLEMIRTRLEKTKQQSEQYPLFLAHGGYCSKISRAECGKTPSPP